MAKTLIRDVTNAHDAFETVQTFKKYLPAVNGALVKADVRYIKMMRDLKRILSAKKADELSSILYYDICSETRQKLGVEIGYYVTLSVNKLMVLLQKIEREYQEQSKLTAEDLRSLCRQQEQLVLKQDNEIQKLNKKINELLELTRNFAILAADKARPTARASKKNFEVAQQTIYDILKSRATNLENPEEIDVQKLQRVSWGKKEKYFE